MSEYANDNKKVVVTDIKMPFGSMVIFLVKLSLASIPALLIFYFVLFVFAMIFVLLFGNVPPFSELFRQVHV